MNSITKDFLKQLLLKQTARKSPAKAREFYWNCIVSSGYSAERESTEDQEYDEDDPYSIFQLQNVSVQQGGNVDYYSQKTLGVTESQQMSISDQYGFNRTFIAPLDNNAVTSSGNRLSELNTWISVSPEETQLKKVAEIIDEVLNGLRLNESTNVRRLAINMYWNIMQYYSTNSLNLSINKGYLKIGYITLVIYYALKYFKYSINIESVVKLVPDARLSYIPKAKKNIQLIFKESPNYSFVNSEFLENSACDNITKLLPNNINVLIENVKRDLIESRIFNYPLSTIQNAACIYYVTSVPLNKGGKLQKRLEITDPVTLQTTKITIEYLASKCGGNFTSPTLAKYVSSIINYYR